MNRDLVPLAPDEPQRNDIPIGAKWIEFNTDAFVIAYVAAHYNMAPGSPSVLRGAGRTLLALTPITREGDEDVKWIASRCMHEWNGIEVNGIQVQRNYNPHNRDRRQRRELYFFPLSELKASKFGAYGLVLSLEDGQ